MNKTELIKHISQNSGISLQKAKLVVNAFLDTISNRITNGNTIRLMHFGIWYVKNKSARKIYNIASGKVETIPAKRVVAFSPSKSLLQQIYEPDVISVEINAARVLASYPKSNKILQVTSRIKQINSSKTHYVEIPRTGIKIDSGDPNFGQRAIHPQTIETGDLKYTSNTSYYKTEATDTENYSYPTHFIPFVDTPILEYRINRFATEGVMEPVLAKALKEIQKIEPRIQILQNISVPIKNRTYGYKPDIAIIWRDKDIFIDIEIDEPYDIISRKPIHYKGSGDNLRNTYFLDNGWNVIRITEKQIVDNCSNVVEYIKECLCELGQDVRFNVSTNIDETNRWSYAEAQNLAEEGYRETYLGIKYTPNKKALIDDDQETIEFAGFPRQKKLQPLFVRPAEDILSDRYGDMRDRISNECLNGKYILFTIKHKCYDYVTYSQKISFIQKNYAYGVELFDIVEEKQAFLRFQEIASFHSLNTLTKYEAKEGDDWNKLLYDAILYSNPIEIVYDKASMGHLSRRKVLFVTPIYGGPFDYDIDNVLKVLEAEAFLKYLKLAKCSHFNYIAGYCNLRQDLRIFLINRIKGGRILLCRKNLRKLSVNDIFELLEKDYANMAIKMYNELQEQEQKDLFHLGNYANALVMQGKYNDALSIYLSINADSLMPQSDKTWKETCLEDFDYFISKKIKKDEFEKIISLLNSKGW